MSLIVYISSPKHCFHPTSKDGLCGAHGRRNGSLHLCHIYCKIKQRIHGDNKSNKLIKIVHKYGRWMVMEYSFYESLSFIWITWGHGYIYISIYIYIFFSSVSFFHGHWCVHFFWVMHLGHAIFFLFFFDSPCLIWKILERERSLNMEFYFVDGWNLIADFQCRSSAGGVHVILIKHVWKTSH